MDDLVVLGFGHWNTMTWETTYQGANKPNWCPFYYAVCSGETAPDSNTLEITDL